MYEEDYTNDTSPSVEKGYIPFSLIYIMSLFTILLIISLICQYNRNRRLIKIINENINLYGEINRKKEIDAISPEVCTICYVDYSDNDEVFTYSSGCNHSYHRDCIKNLFSNGMGGKCPYCNTEVEVRRDEEV